MGQYRSMKSSRRLGLMLKINNMKDQPAILRFEDIQVGKTVAFDVDVTEKLIMDFARLSGDYNPYHVDHKVTHGMLQGAFVSRLVGMYLPGRDALLIKEELSFKHSIRAPAKITVSGVVVHKTIAFRLIEINVTIICNGTISTQGLVHVKMQ